MNIMVTSIVVEEIDAQSSMIQDCLEITQGILDTYKPSMQAIDGQYVLREGNDIITIFAEPYQAMLAAQSIRREVLGKNHRISYRTSLDIPSPERMGSADTIAKNRSQPVDKIWHRAIQLNGLCPQGHILCSDDLLLRVETPQRESLDISGPFFGKLKAYVHPVRFWTIGPPPSFRPTGWQTDRPISIRGAVGHWGERNTSERLATFACAPIWLLTRNRGLYRTGWIMFGVLYLLSKLLNWRRLELHTCIGLSDVLMLLKRHDKAVPWAVSGSKVANTLNDEFYRAQTTYELGHYRAHIEANPEAAGYLQDGFEQFERLADARMAGWSALYLGRCLRGMKRLDEAEDWTQASLVIFSSAGRLKRQVAYGIVQLARLRAAQGRFNDFQWYLQQARALYPDAVDHAPDDALWERELHKIEVESAKVSNDNQPVLSDPTRELVTAVLASLSNPQH